MFLKKYGTQSNLPFFSIFEDMWPASLMALSRPRINVSEDEVKYYVEAELPGISKENISLSYSNETLTLTAERKENKEDKLKQCTRCESYYGIMERQISLPGVKKEEIEAEFKDGILYIKLAKNKNAEQQPSKIVIK